MSPPQLLLARALARALTVSGVSQIVANGSGATWQFPHGYR